MICYNNFLVTFKDSSIIVVRFYPMMDIDKGVGNQFLLSTHTKHNMYEYLLTETVEHYKEAILRLTFQIPRQMTFMF